VVVLFPIIHPCQKHKILALLVYLKNTNVNVEELFSERGSYILFPGELRMVVAHSQSEFHVRRMRMYFY
jgi:hypothetical protein